MTREIINSSKAPKAVGAYSHAVKMGKLLFLSGQIPLDISGTLVGDTIEEQTRQIFKNIKAILEEAGYTLGDIVSCDVFLQDIAEFAGMNKIYAEIFEPFCRDTGYPARVALQAAAIPKGAKLEIKAIAMKE